jgi:putative transposase
MHEPREKTHRLPPDAYRGFVRASFTANLDNRKEYFITAERFQEQEQFLLRALNELQCDSELYLFMPDHLHIIVTGRTPDSDVRAAMSKFKQYSGYNFSKTKSNVRWQKDFFDHIFRREDDLRKQMIYILNNPVRWGLYERWIDYPYKGSTVFDLETMLNGGSGF